MWLIDFVQSGVSGKWLGGIAMSRCIKPDIRDLVCVFKSIAGKEVRLSCFDPLMSSRGTSMFSLSADQILD